MVGSNRSGVGPRPSTAPATPSPAAVGMTSSLFFSAWKPWVRTQERTASGCTSSQAARPCSLTSQMGLAPLASASFRRWELTAKA